MKVMQPNYIIFACISLVLPAKKISKNHNCGWLRRTCGTDLGYVYCKGLVNALSRLGKKNCLLFIMPNLRKDGFQNTFFFKIYNFMCLCEQINFDVFFLLAEADIALISEISSDT